MSISQIKLAIYAVVLVAFLVLAWIAKYYHDKYVDSVTKLATTEQILEDVRKDAKNCSDNTEKLAEAARLKETQVAEAQKQASILAKTNREMASKILSQNSTNPNRCAAALDLIHQHKAQTEKK